MKTKIMRIYLFLSCAVALFPTDTWHVAEELQKELEEKYDITVFPIAKATRAIGYVFTDKNTIIRKKVYEGEFLVEYNLITERTKNIPPPKELEGKDIAQSGELYYDESANTVHMEMGVHTEHNKKTSRYYLLHLDNYRWEEIPELQDIVQQYTYNPISKLLYIDTARKNEGIQVFNMESRDFLKEIEIFGGSSNIFAMYGNPLQVLCRIWIDREYLYYLFDTDSQTGQIFPDVEFSTGDMSLDKCIHIGAKRFLCVNSKEYNEYPFVVLNLETGTQEVALLENFAKKIHCAKKIDDTHYSFLVSSDDGHLLLCIAEYN